MRRLIVLWLGFTLTGCTQVDSSNPYDPNTPPGEQAPASLMGTVSGQPEDGGDPVPLEGAVVLLDGPTKPTDNPFVTGANGRFNFGEIEPATYTLEISHPMHYQQMRTLLADAGREFDLDIVLHAIPEGAEDVGHLTGVAHKSGELVRPTEEQDHSGILVEVEDAGIRTVTNVEGIFDLYINAGSYNLVFSAKHYNLTRRNDVEVRAGETTDLSDSPVVLDPNPGRVSGTVSLEGRGDNQHGDVVVSLQGGSTTTSAPDGSFLLGDVAAGTYTLSASMDGFDTATLAGVVVEGGRETQVPALELSISRGSVSGVVLLAGRSDHSGVTVNLTGSTHTTMTSSAGAFMLPGVEVGTYELTARKDGFVRGVIGAVTVNADTNTDIGQLTLSTRQGDFDINGGAAFTNNPLVTLDLDAADAVEMRISEDAGFGDPTLGDTDYRAYTATVDFTLSSGDGTKTIFVQYKDSAGLESDVFSASIVLDTLPPDIATVKIDDGADYTNNAGGLVTLALMASDATSGVIEMQISNDQVFDEPFEPFAVARVHTLADLSTQGEKTVYVHYRDRAGNQTAQPASDTIIFDTLPPNLTRFVIDDDAQYTNSEMVALTIESPDADFMRLSNQTGLPGALAEPLMTPRSWFLTPGDESKTVYLELIDAAGNTAGEFSDSIVLDTSPPQSAVILIEGGAEYTNSPAPNHSVQITINAPGANEWRMSTNGVTFTDWGSFGATETVSLPTGDGVKNVFAVFRDQACNMTPTVSDSIVLDTNPPEGTIARLGDGSGFSNAQAIPVEVQPTDETPDEMVVWTDGTLDSEPWMPFASQVLASLPPGDGTYTVRVRFRDRAGNLSTQDASGQIQLDRTAPSAVQVLTNSAVMQASAGDPFMVTTAGPTTEANFAYYELLGGTYSSWTHDSSDEVISKTVFTFYLRVDASEEDGLENVLRIRAFDLAGNAGPSASVVVTTDINPPEPVTTNSLWIINGESQGRIFWQTSSSPDVIGYQVMYGSASGVYDGTFALQGVSPVPIGAQTDFALSGLVNGSPVYATVVAVDAAGNLSNYASEVILFPNSVSTDLIADVTTVMDRPHRIALYGDIAYLFGYDWEAVTPSCGTNFSDSRLQIWDISRLVSPVHRGRIQLAPQGPTALGSLSWPDQLTCISGNNQPPMVDMLIDGVYLYLASGANVRVLSLSDPRNPVVVATLNMGATNATALALAGDKLFVACTNNELHAIDLSKLYDGDAATVPTLPADRIGMANNGDDYTGGMTITRNYLLQNEYYGGHLRIFDIADALDGDGMTTWDFQDRTVHDQGFVHHVTAPAIASGNRWYVAAMQSLSVFELNDLWIDGDVGNEDRIGQAGAVCEGAASLVGSQIFTVDESARAVRSYDVLELPEMELETFHPLGFSSSYNPWTTAVYGNYLLVGYTRSQSGHLAVYEIAAPRTLHEIISVTMGNQYGQVQGGFLIGDSGEVADLQSSWPPEIEGVGTLCAYGGVPVGDRVVAAAGTRLRVVDLDDGIDRDDSTDFDASDHYLIDMPAGTLAKAVAALGNHLVVAEERADGVYLEVFDVRKLRDRQGTLSLADSLGSYRVSTATSSDASLEIGLALHRGRALVTWDEETPEAPEEGLHVVDIRPMLDDDAATVMNAASHQGFYAFDTISPPAEDDPRSPFGHGSYAYIASWRGMQVVDISAALDEDPATIVDQTVDHATYDLMYAKDVKVHGSYALLVTGGIGGGLGSLDVVDVSDPLNPSRMGTLSIPSSSTMCSPYVGSPWHQKGTSVSVHGSRAYVTGASGQFLMIELE